LARPMQKKSFLLLKAIREVNACCGIYGRNVLFNQRWAVLK